MTTYIIRRVIQAIIIMAGLTVFFFIILNVEPGGPCEAIRENPNPLIFERYHECIVTHGLDKPLPVQYVKWLSLVIHGDFGIDRQGIPVIDSIRQKLPATILLIGLSYLFQQMLALPLGLLGALKRYTFYDQILTFFSYVGLSMPTFWLGLMLILLFGVLLGWLPPGGIVSPTSAIPPFGTQDYWSYLLANPGSTIIDFIKHLILPGITLAVIGIAADSRFMRASMLDVISQDYVRTARAKGLPPYKVVLKHAVRNALLPIITNVGLFIPALVSGAVITESIFGWPGMGQYFINALGQKDNTTLQAVLLLSALFVLIGNLVADLLYAWVDPRIRYD